MDSFLTNGSMGDILAHLGVGGVIALIVFYYARQDANRHKAEWAAASKQADDRNDKLVAIIQQNSEAITMNTSVTASTESALRELRAEVTRAANGRMKEH